MAVILESQYLSPHEMSTTIYIVYVNYIKC